MTRPTLTTLRSTPLLDALPQGQLEDLTKVSDWQAYKPGEVIIRQNEKSSDVRFVVAGFVKVVRGGKHMQAAQAPAVTERRQRMRPEVMVALLGPGAMLGEVAALLDQGRSASVIALTPCQAIIIPRTSFMACMQRHPAFALSVARKLASRIVEVDRRVELMRGDVEGRIHALIRYCQSLGIDTGQWLTNAEIARMVGATRVAVSRIMNELSRRNDRAGR